MPLADFTPERREVPFKGGAISVRGLSLDDVSVLVRTHYADLETLLRMWDLGVAQAGGAMALERFVLQAARDAPQFAASALLLAADEAEDPAAVAAARRLPFPVLVAALDTIGDLTFMEAGGVQRFAAAFRNLLGGLTIPGTLPRVVEQEEAA